MEDRVKHVQAMDNDWNASKGDGHLSLAAHIAMLHQHFASQCGDGEAQKRFSGLKLHVLVSETTREFSKDIFREHYHF